MKILFASDIHGSASACEQVLERLQLEDAQRFFLLGDLLYHGPRNSLPAHYEPKAVIQMLNECKMTPLCVRGNCDAEIDQMVLQFPIMADYALLELENAHCAFVTHGHLFHSECPPPHSAGDMLIHGHTHVHCVKELADYVYLNPGSAALPKENQPQSYMVYEKGVFTIKCLKDGGTLMSYALKGKDCH
ncbi:MAG: phosphodiesterase [Clostridia bacterium]